MTAFSLINVLFSFVQEKTKCISFSLLITLIKLNGIQFYLLMNRPQDEVTNAIGDNTIRHGEVKTHKQTEVGTTYINGEKVVSTFDSCSSATVINHGIISKSDKIEIEIRDIEDQGYKMSWRNAVDTDTDSMNYVDIHPPGMHLHFPFSNDKTTHCSNRTKARDNTKQIEEESVTFPY